MVLGWENDMDWIGVVFVLDWYNKYTKGPFGFAHFNHKDHFVIYGI